jgi:hypothetical protein
MKRSTDDDRNFLNRFVFLLLTVNAVFTISQPSSAQTPSNASGTFAAPNGADLALGESCYTITTRTDGKERPIGYVFQSLTSDHADGVAILTVVVHQHLSTKKFDMRDRLVLRKTDLTPLHLDTDRDGSPHVHLDYARSRVTGWKMVNGAKQPIDVALEGRVWDGNLWGVTFAALPLKAGANYRLPVYQYDSGKGEFFVTVVGNQKIATPAGEVEAWVTEVGLKPDERVKYLLGQRPRMELGYIAGPMSQHLGGNCGGLH